MADDILLEQNCNAQMFCDVGNSLKLELVEPIHSLDILENDSEDVDEEGYITKRISYGNLSVQIRCLAVLRGSPVINCDFDLTGFMVWPATRCMIHFILAHRYLFLGEKVIELGSGTGLAGLWASQFCSKCVMTDREEDVLCLLQHNIDNNEFPNEKPLASILNWGNEEDARNIMKTSGNFSIVLGTDLIYPERENKIAPLFQTVKLFLLGGHRNSYSSNENNISNDYGNVEKNPKADNNIKYEARYNSKHENDLALEAFGRGRKGSFFLLSYIPRSSTTTVFLHETSQRLGFHLKEIDWHSFTDTPPILGAQLFLFSLFRDMNDMIRKTDDI